MKYPISRVSMWNNKKPCKEAIKVKGKWYVEIKSIQAFNAFVAKYNSVIVDDYGTPETPDIHIAIYDGYVE